MGVDTKHKLYTANETNWKFMRDCIEGDTAIKANGKTYIPSLSGQSPDDYKAYIGRPYFEGYTQRVLDGLTGLMFAKTPTVEAPTQLEALFPNFNLNGSTLTDYVQDISNENVGLGRVGALVDMGQDGTQNRPYATVYKTETIGNWRYKNINNQNTLVMVDLEEIEQNWTDEFTAEDVVIYRVLRLTDEGIYEQHIYKPDSEQTYSITPTEIITPLMNGKPLVYIPFIPFTPEKLVIEPAKPPLLDLARVNVAHFKLNVDYYQGLHMLGLGAFVAYGIQPKELDNFQVGGSTINGFTNPSAKVEVVSAGAEGFTDIRDEKQALIDSMVVLGSNMLQGDKKVAEAEATVAMRSAGQNASLISTADTISRGVTKILEIMAEWMGISGEISYKLNTDFNLTQMSPQLLKEVIVGKTLGEIPRKVVFDTLKAGEIINDDVTFEDFETMLSEEAPIVNNSALPPKQANNDKVNLEKIAKSVGAK